MAAACTSESASFGAVIGNGTTAAMDRFGRGAEAVATLAAGQFVCIHYTADPLDADGVRWLYVTAIPTTSIAACASVKCSEAVTRSYWNDRAAEACIITGGVYGPGCAAGWVPAATVDEYSMGLGGSQAKD